MAENRTSNSFKNIFFNISSQLLTLVLSFISRKVFLKAFGTELLGVNGLFSDVLGLLSMADMGLGTVMVFSLYKPLADKDTPKIAKLISIYGKIYRIIAVVVTAVGLAVVPFLEKIVNTDKHIDHLEIYYLLALLNVVLSYLFVYRTAVLSADQKGYVAVKIRMIFGIVTTLCQILVAVYLEDYVIFLVVGCIFTFLCNFITTIVTQKKYSYIKKVYNNSVDKEEIKRIFGTVKDSFIYKLSTVLLNMTDNLLISVFVSTVAVGFYSNYLMIQNKISGFYVLIFSATTASIGNLIVKGTPEKKYDVFRCEQSVSFILSGIVIPCYVLLVNDFISIWLGEKFVLDFGTILVIGLNMYLACVLQPLWVFRDATGLFRQTKWTMFICALFNLVLSIPGGILWGIKGIILASCVSRIMTYIWYEPKKLFEMFFLKKCGKYYVSLIENAIIVFLLIGANYFIWAEYKASNYFYWCIKAIAIGAECVTIMWIVYRKTEGIELLINKIKKVIRKVGYGKNKD